MPSQPRWNSAWTIPNAAPTESSVMTAAWIGMISERKTTNRRIMARPTTTATNTGSLLDVTCEKSTTDAVGPPM